MPANGPVRVHTPIEFPEIGDVSRLTSFVLMSAIKCDATAQFQAIADAVRQTLKVPYCRISIVDVGRARRIDRAEREALGFLGWAAFGLEVATSAVALFVPNVKDDDRFHTGDEAAPEESHSTRFGIPLLTSGGACVGAICIGAENSDSVSEEAKSGLQLFGRLVVHELELQAYALKDHATGLASQWAFEQFLKSCAEHRVYPSLLLIGAHINDYETHCENLGRVEAERMLLAVGRSFTTALRSSDIVARASGDRIVAACGLRASEDAAICVRRIQSALAETNEIQGHSASLSLAIAEVHEANLVGALADLDAALYAARRMGPNKFVAADKLRLALQLFKAGQVTSPSQILGSF